MVVDVVVVVVFLFVVLGLAFLVVAFLGREGGGLTGFPAAAPPLLMVVVVEEKKKEEKKKEVRREGMEQLQNKTIKLFDP